MRAEYAEGTCFAQPEDDDWAKRVASPDKKKSNSLRPLRLYGEQILLPDEATVTVYLKRFENAVLT